jgi:predicted MFS family arabinose efflux permease
MAGKDLAVSSRRSSPGLLTAVLVFLAVESTAVASLGTPLLPTIEKVDHVSLAASQWALTISLLTGAIATPVIGRLGDGRLRRQTTLGTVTVMLIGCVLSALPAGFAVFLIGRGLQGAGFGLVALVTAVARDDLPEQRSRRAIAAIGVTTAVGIGIGYPLVGLLAQYLGLGAPFWFVTALSALALVSAAAILPASPARTAQVDSTGVALAGLGIAALILTLAQGPAWGWTSAAILACAASAVVLIIAWVIRELQVPRPLIELRLLRRRAVLVANLTGFLVALGFYPLASLVVRYVETPVSAGYGFGAPVVIAGLMLTPFSVASFAAAKIARRLAERTSAETVVAGSCVVLIASMMMFLLARGAYWQIAVAMAIDGLGVGCVFAVNPLQITSSVPAGETGSAISFYQLTRTVAYSVGSALSATVLVLSARRNRTVPTDQGYSTAAIISTAVLVAAFAISALFAVSKRGSGGGEDQATGRYAGAGGD